MYITAFNVEKAESLILRIDQEKSKDYLEKFEFDFEQMAGCLRIRDNGTKLVLLNPFF